MKRFGILIRVVLFSIVIIIALIIMLFGYSDIPLEELKQKYANQHSSFISINGMDVHYRDEGNPSNSIPVVLIHGTGASLHTFEGWNDALISNHRVIRMDIPGYGLTGPFPERIYTIDHYVDFINDFLIGLGVDKCVLGGNSLGGRIVWQYALKYPGRIDKLILIDASGYPNEEESTPLAFKLARMPVMNKIFTFITPKSVARSSVENVYADKSKVTDKLSERYFELTLRKGNRQAFVDRLLAVSDTTAYRRIPEINKEVLIMWGQEDLLIPVELAYRFEKDLTNDTLVIFEKLGHVPMEEDPQLSVVPVLNFLKE